MSKPTLATILLAVAALAACKPKKAGDQSGAGSQATAAPSGGGMPGISATEIKIGQSMPYSGPASAYGNIGKGDAAYFQMINDKGGVNGRKLKLISLDDGYAPPKAVENVRKLVEDEGVALIFNNVGTAANTATQKYLNDKKVPQLFIASTADKWADPAHFPWTMGFAPTAKGEAKVYAHYLMRDKPNAKLCVLFQNDDFGKDYLRGLKDGFGDRHDQFVIKTMSYEITDPTIDSQVVSLQATGCDALLSAATPRFAAQIIRKVFDLGWKPLHLMSNASVSRSAVLAQAGLEKSMDLVTAGYIKDITDPSLADDPGLNEYRAFARQYLQGLDQNDGTFVYAFGVSMALVQVLTQCGNDLSRDNIMKQAANIKGFPLPMVNPGIVIDTSPTDYQPLSQLRLARFNGNNFVPFGDVESAD